MIEIPVPPFGDFATAKRFHQLVMLYLSELKRPGEPVGLPQFLLAEALSWHGARGGPACASCDPPTHSYLCFLAGDQPGGGVACGRCGPPYPCRTLLSVALVARFPVPWTPVSLADVLTSTGLVTTAVHGHRKLVWGGDGWIDPVFTAERDRDGGWDITRVERSQREFSHLADDAALCDHLVDYAMVYPYPYAAHIEPEFLDAVTPGVAGAESWWDTYHRLPYLENHRANGSFS